LSKKKARGQTKALIQDSGRGEAPVRGGRGPPPRSNSSPRRGRGACVSSAPPVLFLVFSTPGTRFNPAPPEPAPRGKGGVRVRRAGGVRTPQVRRGGGGTVVSLRGEGSPLRMCCLFSQWRASIATYPRRAHYMSIYRHIEWRASIAPPLPQVNAPTAGWVPGGHIVCPYIGISRDLGLGEVDPSHLARG
jgi:hypothetical protein